MHHLYLSAVLSTVSKLPLSRLLVILLVCQWYGVELGTALWDRLSFDAVVSWISGHRSVSCTSVVITVITVITNLQLSRLQWTMSVNIVHLMLNSAESFAHLFSGECMEEGLIELFSVQ